MCLPLIASGISALASGIGSAVSGIGSAVGAASSSLSTVAGVTSAVGTGLSAAASASANRAQADALNRQAQMEQQAGAYERNRRARANTQALDRMRGQYLSSGIDLGGSVADVIADSATEASLDEQAILYGTQVRADNYRFEASMARQAGRNAIIGGALGMAGDVLGGFMQQRNNNQRRTMISNPYAAYGAGLY